MDQFWHISYPVTNQSGMANSYSLIASDERQARTMAAMKSRSHGHATVTNREGLVATYVDGAVWQPTTT